MKTAVFLGAGASRTFGYPLTSELLPRMLKRLDDGILFDGTNTKAENDRDRQWFKERLFQFLPGLSDSWQVERVSEESPKIGVSVTDILTLVDRALSHTEARGGMIPEELVRFRQLLDRAIYEALVRGTAARKMDQRDYLGRFSKWLGMQEPGFGVLTTNYDQALDRRLFRSISRARTQANRKIGRLVDFGFSWRTVDKGDLVPRPTKPLCYLFKLHGSINWLRCCLCGQIYLNTEGPIGTKAFSSIVSEWNTCHCNDWARLRLHLVTPSLVRQIQDSNLLGIWQAALEKLRTASRWLIVGYSLPSEDVAIRALFLRAWDGRKKKPKVIVVQRKDKDSVTERAYRAFFPTEHLEYHDTGFEAFIDRRSPKASHG